MYVEANLKQTTMKNSKMKGNKMQKPELSNRAIIPPEEWKWFGTAAHFICGQWCRFHLATQVGEYLISTVGEYVHPSRGGGSELAEFRWLQENWPGQDIGIGRKYETMVFRAGEPCTRKACGCCGLPEIDGAEIACKGYNCRGDATRGHMQTCLKVAARKLKGCG